MAKFRKKPVVIEAHQLTVENQFEVIRWAHEGFPPEANVIISPTHGGVIVRTAEGEMFGGFGDWIIKGIKGEFYPCKSDIFTMTYEPLIEEVI